MKVGDLIETEHIVDAKRGRQEAFDTLYQWLLPRVFRYVLHLTRDRSAAEEITSEAFMLMVKHLATLPDRDLAVLSWLRSVSRNKSVDWIRRRAIQRQAFSLVAQSPQQQPEAPDGPIQHHETVQGIHQALGTLSSQHREVLEFRYLDGATLAEIAIVLGKKSTAVKSLLFRARNALREELERHRSADLLEIDHES